VLLKKTDVFKTVIPTKMLEYMSCARPVTEWKVKHGKFWRTLAPVSRSNLRTPLPSPQRSSSSITIVSWLKRWESRAEAIFCRTFLARAPQKSTSQSCARSYPGAAKPHVVPAGIFQVTSRTRRTQTLSLSFPQLSPTQRLKSLSQAGKVRDTLETQQECIHSLSAQG
jgi:hypothetical protein